MDRMQQPVDTAEAADVGSEESFPRFYEAHYARLARALFLLEGDAAEAEEIAQEAMVRMLERWSRVTSMASPEGYLYRTAMNLNRSRLRRLTVRARHAFTRPPESDPAVGAAARDRLGRALELLPSGQREALVLVEWLGFDAEEAGRILGIEPVSVRVRVSRARSAMRDNLGGDADE